MYVGVYVLVRFVALFSFCTDDDDDVEDASSRARFMRCGTDIRVRRVYRISCIVRPSGRARVRASCIEEKHHVFNFENQAQKPGASSLEMVIQLQASRCVCAL